MREKALGAVTRFAMRNERALTIAGAIWFALSCASYARFIELPRIPFVTDQLALFLSGAWNAVWWSFLHPAIESKRKQLAVADNQPPAA